MRNPRGKTKWLCGLTLIEIIVTLSLMSLIFSLGFVYMRGGVASADSHSLALVVASQLRLARQSAMATQEPVAVIFPNNGGATPLCQSLYVATGLSMAHVTQVVNFRNNHPGAELFTGVWQTTGTSSFSIYPTLSDQRYGSFNVTRWLGNPNMTPNPMPTDYVILFQPDGTVFTNGLPFLHNGAAADAYYIVACAGCVYNAAGTPTNQSGTLTSLLSYFTVSAAVRPWAIGVTPRGEISLQSGLPQAGAMQFLGDAIPVGSNQGVPPAPTVMPNINPGCLPPSGATGCWFTPTATNTGLLYPSTPNVNMTIVPGQRASMAVNVSETSGRDLYVQWTCTPVSANNPSTYPACGNFSYTAPEKMTWDPIHQVWTSTWDWLCPVNAQNGDLFSFQCAFGDGSAMVAYPAVSQQFLALKGPKLWAVGGGGWGFGGRGLYRGNADGSALTKISRLPASLSDCGFTVSTDGACVALHNPGNGIQIYSGISDTKLYTIPCPGVANASSSLSDAPVAISPRGDQIAFGTVLGTTMSLQVGPLTGPFQTIFSETFPAGTNWGWMGFLAWSPDQNQIAFTDYFSGSAPPYFGDIKTISKSAGVWPSGAALNTTCKSVPPLPGVGWGGRPADAQFGGWSAGGPLGGWTSVGVSGMCYQPDGKALFFGYVPMSTRRGYSAGQVYKYDLTTPGTPPVQWSNLGPGYMNLCGGGGGALAFLPNGSIVVTDKAGLVYSLPNVQGAGSPTPLACNDFLKSSGAGFWKIFTTNN